MTIEDKLNLLSNYFSVTEETLKECLELEKPFVINENLYLAFSAVMIDRLQITPKHSLNLLNHLLNKFDVSLGFENTFYRVWYDINKIKGVNRSVYLSGKFGHYHLTGCIVFLENIDIIEEFKLKLS
jgi:hypothetical protein